MDFAIVLSLWCVQVCFVGENNKEAKLGLTTEGASPVQEDLKGSCSRSHVK